MCYVELTLDAGEGLLWFAGCRLFVLLGAAFGPAVCVTRRCLRPGRLCYSALPSARPFVLLGAAFGPAGCVTRRCLRPAYGSFLFRCVQAVRHPRVDPAAHLRR